MRYQISGKQIDIGEALQAHVQAELNALLDKYHGRPTDAHIVFSKDGPRHACETVIHLSTGLNVSAKAKAVDIYASFDNCADKIDTQLRRYKRRLKDHHHERTQPIDQIAASTYILATDDSADESEPDSLQPIIIAEMETNIPTLSVGEAVMQMELAGAPVLVFRNEGSEGVNVVYRREDGNIGWIDPTQEK